MDEAGALVGDLVAGALWWAAVTLGTMTGSLRDPIQICFLILCVVVAGMRWRLWTLLIVPIAASAFGFLAAYPRYAANGLDLSGLVLSAEARFAGLLLVGFVIRLSAATLRRALSSRPT
ncbi:hypothetical protein [Rhizobium sp. 12,4]|uniref:hypothetical protein n=1 Tax=Rhizobium sp. 12,4 TaxID=3405135 RepID=UPI003D345754